MSRLAPVVCVFALLGCGPSTIGDLPRPALIVIVQEPGGFCSAAYAVDASDRVWLETGCASSSGLVAQDRSVTDAERAELDALMDSVLAEPNDPGCEVPSPSARRFHFVRTLAGTDAWPDTRQCEPAVPADALELVRRMEALVGRVGDGGPARDAGLDAAP